MPQISENILNRDELVDPFWEVLNKFEDLKKDLIPRLKKAYGQDVKDEDISIEVTFPSDSGDMPGHSRWILAYNAQRRPRWRRWQP